MKLFVQWSEASARDWQEVESVAWGSQPMKPQPVGGEVIDATPGWPCAVNCQGVEFIGYDHYVCESITGGGCRISTWKDDLEDAAVDLVAGNVPSGLNPADYSAADLFYARGGEFDPVARYDGRSYNTRQRQTVYAGRALRDYHATLGPVENTIVHPWEEFVAPAPESTRHGVWMSDALMRAHEAARTPQRWMDWAPEPVIPQGPEHHSITYLLNAPDTADSDCATGPDHNNKMDEVSQTSEDLSSVFAGGTFKASFIFTTLAGDPNVANWPNGLWRCDMNIVAAGVDITYGLLFDGATGGFKRVGVACSTLDSWSQDEAAFSGTGVKSATKTYDTAAGLSSNRFQVRVHGIRAASMGNQTLTLRTNASSFAQGPWAVAAASFMMFPARLNGIGRGGIFPGNRVQ